MNLRYLRFFIAVAEERNFTRAAERLHTVQPSLSRQIQQLEEIVGAALFRRARGGLQLTEAGRIFLDEARGILSQVDRAISAAQKGARAESGHLTIGFIPGSEMRIMSNFLPVLKERCPEMTLSCLAMSEPAMLEGLENGQINAAFLTGPIESPSIDSRVVLRERIMVALPGTHPLARNRKIDLARLSNSAWIRPSVQNSPKYRQVVDEMVSRAGVTFTATVEQDNVLSAFQSVGLGFGFALVPEYQREILPTGIVARPIALEPQPMIESSVAYRKDHKSPALATFLKVLRECMLGSAAAAHLVNQRLADSGGKYTR